MSQTIEKSGRSMLDGAPWCSLLQFALPIMGANVLQQLYNTVDTLVVGNFESQNALSAVGSCAYLTMFYLAFAMGFSNAAGVLTAQRLRAGDEKGMKSRYRHYSAAWCPLLIIVHRALCESDTKQCAQKYI